MTIDQIIDGILEAEGEEYTNDPTDHGGPTKYGVTLGAWQAWGHPDATAADIEALTEADVRPFYLHVHLWEPGFNAITDPWVQAFMVDFGVLEGVPTAIHLLQHNIGVSADGIFGPLSLAAVNAHDPKLLKKELLVARMHYLLDVMVNEIPRAQIESTNLKFRHGWTNRVFSFL
jgi:lysozyme family protein